jgi:hypothetical protein
MLLTVKSKARPSTRIMQSAEEHNLPVHVIKKNVSSAIMKFLKFYFKLGNEETEDAAMQEVDEAIKEVKRTRRTIDLTPQNSYFRRLQHQQVESAGLRSESVGDEPKRRLRVYPQK